MAFRTSMASNRHQQRLFLRNPVMIPKWKSRLTEFVERSTIWDHRGMHNSMPPGKVTVPPLPGMKNQMVVMFQSLGQYAKVRLVLRIEQCRKATRCKDLLIRNMLQYVVCEIGGPLLR